MDFRPRRTGCRRHTPRRPRASRPVFRCTRSWQGCRFDSQCRCPPRFVGCSPRRGLLRCRRCWRYRCRRLHRTAVFGARHADALSQWASSGVGAIAVVGAADARRRVDVADEAPFGAVGVFARGALDALERVGTDRPDRGAGTCRKAPASTPPSPGGAIGLSSTMQPAARVRKQRKKANRIISLSFFKT